MYVLTFDDNVHEENRMLNKAACEHDDSCLL
jgi:hypothetical protein